MTLHPHRPSDRARTRGRVEWQPHDRHQPYALFDDDGTLLRVEYTEPAAALLPGASSTPGA